MCPPGSQAEALTLNTSCFGHVVRVCWEIVQFVKEVPDGRDGIGVEIIHECRVNRYTDSA